MGKLTISGFDTRYENFPTWKEPLEFEVDGVLVKAVAVHSWRQEWVDITEPFHLGVSVFCAPLICIGEAMLGRRKALAARGLTERDDCIRVATHAYRREATYFRIKPEVDREQEEFLSVFRAELEMLLNESNQAKDRLRTERRGLRQQLHAHELDPQKYQALLTVLQKEDRLLYHKYYSQQSDVNRELDLIKIKWVDQAMATKDKTN